MKKTLTSKVLSFVMAVLMVFGVASTGLIVIAETTPETIKYVSIGDSMTNGYGFDGYNQDKHTVNLDVEHLDPKDYNYFDGTGVYGEGSYANQFADYLTSKGYSVEHTKLALSAFRPEDLIFLIDDSIDKYDWTKLPLKDGYFNNSWAYVWAGCEDYVAQNSNTEYQVNWDYNFCHEPGTSCGASGYVAYNVRNYYNYKNWYPDYVNKPAYPMYNAQFNELKTYFQESLTEADVISLALGNAAFDAYFMDRLFMIWGPDSEWKNGRNEITIADVKEQLCETEAEKAMVEKLYAVMQSVVGEKISDEDYSAMKMDRVCQLMTYVTFSYMYSYKQVIEWIGNKNPDAQVMIVGLLNSHHGITMTQDGEMFMDMGEGMGAIYDMMNTYVAGVASKYMEDNDDFTGKFLYVEQPENPEMIATVIGELDQAGWGLIDCGVAGCEDCANGKACENGRLDGEIVRVKTIPVFVSFFAKPMGYWYAGAQYTNGLFSSDMELLAAIQNAIDNNWDVVTAARNVSSDIDNALNAYGDAFWNADTVAPLGALTANVIYLACEQAMVTALESSELEVEALVSYADGSMSTLLNSVDKTILPTNKPGQEGWADTYVPTVDDEGNAITLKYIYDYFYEFYTSEEMLPMMRFLAINKVGNGIAAHPTPSNHDRLAENMIAAYKNGYTVQDKCKDSPAPMAANEIYVALTEKGLLTTEQVIDIMDCVAGAITDGVNTTAIMDSVYEILFYADITDAQRVQIVSTVYTIINKWYKLADNNPNVQAVENISTYLYNNKYIDDEQAVLLVDYIYWTVSDGIQANDIKDIFVFAYLVIFEDMRATVFAALDDANDPSLNATQKLEIFMTVYEELKAANPEIVETNPELVAVENLYDALSEKDASGESLLSDEQLFAIVDTAVKSFVIEEKPMEDAVKDVTNEVTAQIEKLPAEKKLAVIEKVGETIEELSKIEGGSDLGDILGGSDSDNSIATMTEFVEYFAVARKAVENLKAEGLFTDYADEKFTVITTSIIAMLMDGEELDLDTLVGNVYEMLFEQPGLTAKDKNRVVIVIYETLKEAGIVDFGPFDDINYYEDLGLELLDIVEKNFAPVVEQLEGEIKELNKELEAKTDALNEKLMELTEKQEVILKDMLADRDAIAAELEALEEELAGLYAAPVSANGITKKMTATTVANTEEELVADLEAAIAETKAALDELDAAIAYVKGQIETDKSGIEAIKAAIEEIKANIAATEAALAEVNAAMNKLVSDLEDLGIDLELLKKVAAGVKIDPDEIYEAVKGLLENLPETIATIEDLYEAAVEAVETAKAAVEAIKTSVEVINAKVENIIKSAEDLIVIEGEKAEEIKKAAEEIYALAEAFVKANLPAIEEALENTAAEVDVVIAREIAKVEALWAEYGIVVKAAIGIAYLYCEEKGYIQLAEDYITDYIETAEEALEDLEKYLEELDLEDLENLDVEEIIAELEAEYGIDIDTTEAEVVIAKIKAYIQSVKDEIAKAKKALEDAKAVVELLTSDAEAVFEALANLKETLCDLGNSVCDLKAAVKDEVLKLVGYANLIGEKVLGVVDTLDAYADIFVDGVIIAKNGIIAVIEELVYEATHADYVKDKDSYYVAFGDGTAVSESYVDLLAKELEVKFNNLAQAGLKVEDMFDIIDANVAEIKKADLITIGFGNNTFITEALNNALDYENAPEYDWAKYVGEEGAEYVAKALAELKAMLDEEGLGEIMGMPLSELAVIAVESYAYSCVAYAVNLPMIANKIVEINPEALVILIGMYNPLEGVVIDLGETKLDISDYLGYLAKAAGLESLIYAIVTGDATYVSAPDVDTKLDSEVLGILDIIYEFAINQGENLDPSADGHEYIKNQILEALNVTEEEVILLGDANNDGEVNAIDAMYILQYDAELIDAEEINLELADVNGDGKVNSIDAMYVLRYDAELIEKFPAEDKAA